MNVQFVAPVSAQLTADEFAFLRERLLSDLDYAAINCKPPDFDGDEMDNELRRRTQHHGVERYRVIGSILAKLGVAIPEFPWYPWLKEIS